MFQKSKEAILTLEHVSGFARNVTCGRKSLNGCEGVPNSHAFIGATVNQLQQLNREFDIS
jgi:hypothetical protein